MRFTGADIAAMEDRYRVFLVNGLSGFKGVSLVGTANSAGQDNLAIFSSVVHIGANPPLLGIISRPNTVRRDTLENIAASGWFTLNHVHGDMIEAAHQTAARYEANVSEFEAVGLTPLRSKRHPAPLVAESRLRIALKHRETIDIAVNGTHLVIGEIAELFIEDGAVADDGFVDLAQLDSVSVAGLDAYCRPGPPTRFSYAKPNRTPRRL